MIFARIMATGTYLPKTILSNDDIAKQVETSHEWILERTGIEKRHIAADFETTTMMGAWAAREALQTADISPEEIDMVIVATCTPDKVFPSTACLIQQELGIPPGPAFDVQAACSGFIYGLSIIDQFIRSGMIKRALLIGSEAMSRVVDWQDRRTCVLFGDGAGAVLLEATSKPGILATHISADGRQKDILYLENNRDAYIQMQGNSVFKLAVNMLGEVAIKTLIENNLTVSDIDWLIPHQANLRIIQATALKLGLPLERVVVTLSSQGNTSSASIPLALDTAIRQQKIKPGHHLLLEAFGGGLTWGTALVRW